MGEYRLTTSYQWTCSANENSPVLAPLPVFKEAVSRARVGDEYQIAQLLLDNAPVCLPLGPTKLMGCLPFYRVVHKGQRIVGTFALFPINAECYELRSVAVAEDQRRCGLGRRLVSAALERAAGERKRVYCVTTKPDFFAHFGFREVPFGVLPPKPERKLFPSAGPSINMYWDESHNLRSGNPGEWDNEELRHSA